MTADRDIGLVSGRKGDGEEIREGVREGRRVKKGTGCERAMDGHGDGEGS